MEDQVNRLVTKVWDKFQAHPPDRRFSECCLYLCPTVMGLDEPIFPTTVIL